MLIGIVNFIGSLIAIYPVKTFNRKPLLVGGHLTLTLLLFSLGVCVSFETVDTALVLLLFLWILCIFQQTVGPITWIYTAEIASDTGLSIALSIYKGTLLLISLSTEFLMDSTLRP